MPLSNTDLELNKELINIAWLTPLGSFPQLFDVFLTSPGKTCLSPSFATIQTKNTTKFLHLYLLLYTQIAYVTFTWMYIVYLYVNPTNVTSSKKLYLMFLHIAKQKKKKIITSLNILLFLELRSYNRTRFSFSEQFYVRGQYVSCT